MLIDTHAHYDDGTFDADREALFTEMETAGVGAVLNVCAAPESLSAVPDLVRTHPFIYGAIGLHPDEVGWFFDNSSDSGLGKNRIALLEDLLAEDKMVAVGEIGLDYHWMTHPKEVQEHWFREQLHLARRTGKPVIVHSREAAADTLAILQDEDAGTIGGVMHCYAYSVEMAQIYVDMGWYLGIGGVVTFKNGKKMKEVVKEIPLSRLLLETDCPYLAPEPHRGSRNSSLYLPLVVDAIAQIKGIPPQEVEEVTTENARCLFGIPA